MPGYALNGTCGSGEGMFVWREHLTPLSIRGPCGVQARENAARAVHAVSRRSQLTLVRSQLPSVRGQLTSVRGQLTSVRSQLPLVRGQLTSVRSQLTSVRGQLTSVRSQLTSVRSQQTSAAGTSVMGQVRVFFLPFRDVLLHPD
jgi:hypothetical protein